MDNYNELIYRGEDILPEELNNIYVDSESGKKIIEKLKGKMPILLEGSRGTGKTILFKVTENQLDEMFNEDRILAVLVRFNQSLLIEPKYFKQWMLSKILFAIKSKLRRIVGVTGQIDSVNNYFNLEIMECNIVTKLNEFINLLETSWSSKTINIEEEIIKIFGLNVNTISVLNEVDYFNEIINEICLKFKIKRIVILFDEPCHSFIPFQQREFFTLFRELRTSYINCKAAIYPGIASYGENFDKFNDATLIKLERNIIDSDYIEVMREIVKKQVSNDLYKKFEESGEVFNSLIYSACGNPRWLLKSIYNATDGLEKSLKSKSVNDVIKDFYRNEIWNEHYRVAEKYKGHKDLVKWGREFIENIVINDISFKNLSNTEEFKTIYFLIDKDAPELVKASVRVLEYTGIVRMDKEGLKKVMSHRSILFDRYRLNLGMLLANEKQSNPTSRCLEIVRNLSYELGQYYTMNSPAFKGAENFNEISAELALVVEDILTKSIDEIDLTQFQRETLHNSSFDTLGDILKGKEADLKKAYGIGEVKSRRIYNIAINAVMEYISG
ncbi:MAG: hypothetical protein AB6733_04950 [Clostridiaceae bacterium]